MQSWVVRRTGSTAIAADRAHYLTDVGLNVAVLAALAVTKDRMDPRRPRLRARHLGLHAVERLRHRAQALEQLLDRELPSEERRKIKAAVRACAGVRDIHDLRTRFSGDRTFVEYHLEVDPGLTVDAGHAIGDATEVAVQKAAAGQGRGDRARRTARDRRRAARRRRRRRIMSRT